MALNANTASQSERRRGGASMKTGMEWNENSRRALIGCLPFVIPGCRRMKGLRICSACCWWWAVGSGGCGALRAAAAAPSFMSSSAAEIWAARRLEPTSAEVRPSVHPSALLENDLPERSASAGECHAPSGKQLLPT
ncbi:hypothetical protein MHYP_G00317040 [Metynnis hypsauchen]